MKHDVAPYAPCPCGSGEKFKFCCGKTTRKGNLPAHVGIEQSFQIAFGYHRAGDLARAKQLYRQVLSRQPNHAEAVHNLGLIEYQAGNSAAAIDLLRQANHLKPDWADGLSSLGNALLANGQVDEAVAAYRQAIVLKPESAEAHNNLGVALQIDGQYDGVIDACRKSIALKPDFPEAHKNLALALLARGDYSAGWDEYEWRHQCKSARSQVRNFAEPPWGGQALGKARLLLHAEQGFGDTLQFIRYLPLAAQCGGNIILECQEGLQRLVRMNAGEFPVVSRGQPLPAFDVHCPLLGLPRVFGTRLETIPRHVPYLHADVAEVQRWRDRLAGDPNPIKIGLAWAGNKKHTNDRNRSMTLSLFAPFVGLPGVSYYSLQKGEPAEQVKNPRPDCN